MKKTKYPTPEQVFLDSIKSLIKNLIIENINYEKRYDVTASDIVKSTQERGKYILEKIDEWDHLVKPFPPDEKSLSDKFKIIFDSGHKFNFTTEVKRKDGDWDSRIMWIHNGEIETQCEWFGFDSIDECVDDCIKYLNKLEKEKNEK